MLQPRLAGCRGDPNTEAVFRAIADKRVAVVGNATSLFNFRYGRMIDGHDIVIRMNRGLPGRFEIQGERTDVLVFSKLGFVSHIYSEFGAKLSIWMSPKDRDKIASAERLPPEMVFYDLARWERLHRLLGSRPSVGAMTLDLLVESNPMSVTIFGFDFKRTSSFYQERQHQGPHDYTAERIFCHELVGSKGWELAPC